MRPFSVAPVKALWPNSSGRRPNLSPISRGATSRWPSSNPSSRPWPSIHGTGPNRWRSISRDCESLVRLPDPAAGFGRSTLAAQLARASARIREIMRMRSIANRFSTLGRTLVFATAGPSMLSTAANKPVAASVINAASVPLAKQMSDGLTTQVRFGHGGGGFHGGGFRGGGLHGGDPVHFMVAIAMAASVMATAMVVKVAAAMQHGYFLPLAWRPCSAPFTTVRRTRQ
jgi:hypothetical protein